MEQNTHTPHTMQNVPSSIPIISRKDWGTPLSRMLDSSQCKKYCAGWKNDLTLFKSASCFPVATATAAHKDKRNLISINWTIQAGLFYSFQKSPHISLTRIKAKYAEPCPSAAAKGIKSIQASVGSIYVGSLCNLFSPVFKHETSQAGFCTAWLLLAYSQSTLYWLTTKSLLLALEEAACMSLLRSFKN